MKTRPTLEELKRTEPIASLRRWERKREEYRKADILPWQEGGGENGTLIETRDDSGGALDAEAIAQVIEEVLA